MTSMDGRTNDPRIQRILDTAGRILTRSPELAESIPDTDDELDRLALTLDAVWNEMLRWQVEQAETEQRMSEVMGAILNIASLDFSQKVPLTGSGDLFDAIATGLNALGEELLSSVVSRDYLDSIIQSMLDSLIVTDNEGVIKTVNQATLDLLGYAESELLGRTLDVVCAGCSDVREFESRTSRQIYLAKDGRKAPVMFSVSPLHSSSGELEGYVCAARDITEQARAEDELRESEQRLRTVLENMPVMLNAFGPDMTISVWNHECARVTGYSAEEMVGNPDALELLYPDKDYFQQMMEMWAEIGSDFTNVEWDIVCKDGTSRTIFWSNISERVPIPGWASWAVGVDVTEQKRAEAALRDSEERYRAIFDQAADAIGLFDPSLGMLVEFNKSAHENLGYSRDEYAKLKVADFEMLDGVEEIQERGRQIIETGGASFETKHRHKNGSIRDVLVNSHAITLQGKQYIQSIWYDITERKEVEQVIRQMNEKLEQRVAERTAELSAANEEVKQFAYIVSHDLRSPLVNLRGFSTELKYTLKDVEENIRPVWDHLNDEQRKQLELALKEEIPEALGFIESSVLRMDTFTGAILQLSRLGRHELKLEHLDMNEIIQSSLAMLAYTIEQNQVEIVTNLLPEIRADRVAIGQIMSNILNNAVNYLDPERPGRIEIESKQDDNEATIYIRDNGRGIAEEDMPKVFAPFRRAGRQDVQGEGMGLAYVQALVRRQGGQIWCESEPGVGSIFAFTIPTNTSQEDEING